MDICEFYLVLRDLLKITNRLKGSLFIPSGRGSFT